MRRATRSRSCSDVRRRGLHLFPSVRPCRRDVMNHDDIALAGRLSIGHRLEIAEPIISKRLRSAIQAHVLHELWPHATSPVFHSAPEKKRCQQHKQAGPAPTKERLTACVAR